MREHKLKGKLIIYGVKLSRIIEDLFILYDNLTRYENLHLSDGKSNLLCDFGKLQSDRWYVQFHKFGTNFQSKFELAYI